MKIPIFTFSCIVMSSKRRRLSQFSYSSSGVRINGSSTLHDENSAEEKITQHQYKVNMRNEKKRSKERPTSWKGELSDFEIVKDISVNNAERRPLLDTDVLQVSPQVSQPSATPGDLHQVIDPPSGRPSNAASSAERRPLLDIDVLQVSPQVSQPSATAGDPHQVIDSPSGRPSNAASSDCYPRRSSVNNLISGRANKLNTRLLDSIPDIAKMKRLLDIGANPNATCHLNHASACHIAAMHDNDALELLLRSGACKSRSDKHGRTPLDFAAWAGHPKQIALLLSWPEEVNRVNVDSGLLDEWSDGVEHNCRNVKEIMQLFQQGWTALHYASARAHRHCVQLLLAAGADVNAEDLLCRTPLEVAGFAHAKGYNIDVENFTETINLLLKAGGKFRHDETLLHTAVELESEAAVEQLLRAGASITVWNSEGLTPMHICVKKRNKELLQILANHNCSNEDREIALVDTKDRSGATVLCAAVKEKWTEGVCVALGAGASIIMQSNGEYPIHIATQWGNLDLLQEILAVAECNRTIDFCDGKGETALFKAISCNRLDVLILLLKNGASIEVNNSDKANVFHEAAKLGNKEILEHLLKCENENIEKLINMSDSGAPPLYYAIIHNHSVCAALLISKGARVDAICYDYDMVRGHYGTRLLHIAARKNRYEIAKMITKHDSDTIHGLDSRGWTPLHVACHFRHIEMIKLLVREGADLSGVTNEKKSDSLNQIKRSPIEMLMNNEMLEEILDSYITTERYDFDWDITVDYKVLVPKPAMKQMNVIKALLNTGRKHDQDKLLYHPVIQSFLYLRWRSVLPFFLIIFAVHVCCTLSLNVFVLSLFWYKDRKIEPVPSIFCSTAWIYVIYLTAFLISIQELIFTAMQGKRILLCVETWVKFLSLTLTIILPPVASWNSEPISEIVRLLASTAVLSTWVKMIFLVSVLPEIGYYFLIYVKVASRFIKILLLFLFVLVGFSMSFMIQFHAQPPFEDPWSSLLTTFVMMAAEFNYDTMKNESATNSIHFPILLLFFVILIVVVLMTLLSSVPVDDINHLKMVGKKQRLMKQVEFISLLEEAGCNSFIKVILTSKLFNIISRYVNRQWNDSFVMRSNSYENDTYSPDRRLPAHIMKDIYEKAQQGICM